jgi:uncharacterized protein
MTENELQLLIRQYLVPKKIMAHSQKLSGRGEKIDIVVLRQAALLHDLVKICDFKNPEVIADIDGFTGDDIHFWMRLYKSCHADGHIVTVCNILSDLKEPVLAEIIKKHRYDSVIDPDPRERPVTWEEKVLLYADKRVSHDKIVSLKERLKEGLKRYYGGAPRPEDVAVENALIKLEKEICDAAGIKPEDIKERE